MGVKYTVPEVVPAYRLRPSRMADPMTLDDNAYCDQIDEYFTRCHEASERPMFTEFALAMGFDSVAQLVNDARRRPSIMRALSRACLLIGTHYEEMLQEGSCKAAEFILSKLPSFDTREASSQLPSFVFRDRQEIQVRIAGVEQPEERGMDMAPREAYLQLIRNKMIEDSSATEEKVIEGDYVEIPIGDYR